MQYSVKSLLLTTSTLISHLDAEVLLSHVLKKDKTFFLSHPEHRLTFFQWLKFRRLAAKRARGVPVAHLTGHKEFFGLDFLVSKHTLIPRPETETLIQCVLDEIRNPKSEIPNPILIDVGTGSGCIPIAIAKTIEQFNNRTIKTYATDISRGALKVAKKNAQRHNVNITFLHGDLFSPFFIFHSSFSIQHSAVVITANLPYLTAAQFASEPSIQHEPKSALVAADNGLALYKKLLKQIQSIVSSFSARLRLRANSLAGGQFPVSLFIEIDPSQSLPLASYIGSNFPNARVEIKKDLAGLDRVMIIRPK